MNGSGPGALHALLARLTSSAARTALLFQGRALTFGGLDALSRRHAGGLARLGVAKGDRVALLAEACPEIVAALLGHYRLGALHVPVNTRYRAEEAAHVLRDSGAVAVLHDAKGGKLLREIGPLSALRHRLALDALLGEPPLAEAAPHADADAALLVYTSGTTGRSKGVALSFGALAANLGALTALWRFTAADRLVLALPLFHVHGLGIGLHAMLLHGTVLLLEPRFEAARVLEAFAHEGATVFLGVPTMYARLLEHLQDHPEAAAALARGRLFTSGSAPLPAADLEAFAARTGHRILERYGMTETLFTLSNPYEGERRAGTVGLPVPGCAVRIVDEEGRDVPDGALGEIVVRGAGMMSGYFGMPVESAAAFRDGWFLTGDVARRASDGYVTIEGRRSTDVIKCGGFKISAREIEEVLARHPLVKEVAVLGEPDRTWGERIVAAVVLREEGAPPGEAELLAELSAFAAKSLADYKRPRAVRLLPALPRNAMGKVQKTLLRTRPSA